MTFSYKDYADKGTTKLKRSEDLFGRHGFLGRKSGLFAIKTMANDFIYLVPSGKFLLSRTQLAMNGVEM